MAVFKGSIVQNILSRVTNHLGEDATFKPCNGTAFAVRVVFDKKFEIIDPDTETVISSNQPRVLVNLSDFPDGIEKGDQFLFETDSRKYVVWTVQEDGQGGAQILLHQKEKI